jgi:mannose-6-phosphate isomerase
MVWGGRRLQEFLRKPLPTNESYGESWEISDHALHHSVVAGGAHQGRSLRELMEHERGPLLGSAARGHSKFPWLVKFIDAQDWLSVQVHPDRQAVRSLLPGEEGKTEAWLVLDADPGSRIYAGLLPGTDETRLRTALEKGSVADCLHQFEPRPGDFLFLPAGTVHAVGGGVLMTEVQQTSDATFRLFDWNRRDAHGKGRALHIEQALASIHWDQGPVNPKRIESFRSPVKAIVRPLGEAGRIPLVDCAHFQIDFRRAQSPFVCGGQESTQVLIMVEGRGHWLLKDCREEAQVGQAWLLPASLPPTEFRPDGVIGFLLCSLPVT